MSGPEATFGQQEPPRQLRAEQVAADYLIRSDLLPAAQIMAEGATLIATRRDRATAVNVVVGGRGLYHLKIGAAHAREWSQREIRCCRAIAATGDGTAITPELIGSDLDKCITVTEMLEPAHTLHDFFTANPLFSPDVLGGLASVMAGLHGLASDASADVPSALPWVLSREDADGRDEQLARWFPEFSTAKALLDHLALARDTWREEALIHGDMKWDNCLLIGDGEVMLVDWELAGLGDQAWDLATAMQEFLLHVENLSAIGREMSDVLGTTDAGRATAHLLAGYLAAIGATGADRDGLIARTGTYVGCRLVQTSLELAAVEGGVGPDARAAMDLACHMVDHADLMMAALLALGQER